MSQTPEKPIQSFQEFWPFYLSQHQNSTSQKLHVLGSLWGLMGLVLAIVISKEFLLYGFIGGYGFAWIGHFVFEKNRPATFRYPLWSFIADFKLLGLKLLGKI